MTHSFIFALALILTVSLHHHLLFIRLEDGEHDERGKGGSCTRGNHAERFSTPWDS